VHPDHLGTPRAVTRASDNQFVWKWDNTEPFGNSAPNDNPSGLGTFVFNHRFPGQYFDVETGTHYNYKRDYDPSLGRYLQSDPIGLEGGLSTYGYAFSDPLSFADPTGENAVLCAANDPPPKDCKACEKLKKAARVVCLVWCLAKGQRPPPETPPPPPPRREFPAPPTPPKDPPKARKGRLRRRMGQVLERWLPGRGRDKRKG
jgi:RHS repeat-associated protein